MSDAQQVGRFVFGICVILDPEQGIRYEIEGINTNVPREIVIMNLRAFLRQLEKDYFDDFRDTAQFRKE